MIRKAYTFKFDKDNERRFNTILNNLGEDEYELVEDTKLLDESKGDYSDRQAIYRMGEDTALVFRMGMRTVDIRRERTEEELAEEKALAEANDVKINIHLPDGEVKTIHKDRRDMI